MQISSILCFILFSIPVAFASPKKVAVVKLLRGTAKAIQQGQSSVLKAEDWVEDGAVVKTEEKSFVKLVFLDKSSMNIGPSSEMKIEKFNGKDSGVIDLVKGKIRSQVTKDYLQIKDKDKSKLFIKTNNAVMGVRGTDFMISTNGMNTATVLFEGEVVFNNLPDPRTIDTGALEQTVNAGVRMVPGEFSVVDAGAPPTVPSVLNVQQLEKLEKNPNFSEGARNPASSSPEAKSVVPPGLSGAVVSNTSNIIKAEVAQLVEVSVPRTTSTVASANGYADGNSVKPTNGSFIHIESGVIIPPPPGSVLDPNTNTYIPAAGAGEVAADGSYVPPANVEITTDGKVLVSVTNNAGQVVQKEVPKPSPVAPPVAVVNTAVTPPAQTESGRAPASIGGGANTFTAAAQGSAPPIGGTTAVNQFNGGLAGNPNIPLPTAGVTPQNNPAETSRIIPSFGDYTIKPQRQ